MRRFKGDLVFGLLMVVGLIAIVWLVMMRSQAELPREVRDLSRIRAEVIVDNFKDGGQFCNRPDYKTSSCEAVQTLETVNTDGITVRYLEGKPFSHKVTQSIKLVLKDNMLCRTYPEIIQTALGYHSSNDLAEISNDDIIASLEKQEEFRALIKLSNVSESEFCWSYWAAPSDELDNKLIMVKYIDGVLQQFDHNSTAAFFTSDSKLRIKQDID